MLPLILGRLILRRLASGRGTEIKRSSYVARLLIMFTRACQVFLALIVCGIYAVDLVKSKKNHEALDSKWLYAVGVAGLTVLTSLILGPCFPMVWVFLWDGVML